MELLLAFVAVILLLAVLGKRGGSSASRSTSAAAAAHVDEDFSSVGGEPFAHKKDAVSVGPEFNAAELAALRESNRIQNMHVFVQDHPLRPGAKLRCQAWHVAGTYRMIATRPEDVYATSWVLKMRR